jgi:Cysteine-rich CPXCG
MRLARRLRRLLKRRGVRLTDTVKQSLRDFVATVSEENPDYVDPSADADEDEVTSASEPAQQHPITCPHCGETIDIAVDLSGPDQDDVQDCSVCCSPIHVTYSARDGHLHDFTSEPY